jgi:hypothetical protein
MPSRIPTTSLSPSRTSSPERWREFMFLDELDASSET